MRPHAPLAPLLLAFLATVFLRAQERRTTNPSLIAPSTHTNPFVPITSYAYDEPKVVFRTSTRLVQIPVVVSDKSGHHINKLPKDQFTVLENGKEQKISTFEEVIADNSRPLPPAPPGTFRNAGIEFHQ